MNTRADNKRNRPGRGYALGVGLMLLTAAVVVTGCSIFDTREDEVIPPGALPPGKEPWVNPNDASNVFANLKTGIENLDGENYNRSLSDEFDFIPLVDDEVDLGPETFENWDIDTEKSVMDFMVSGPDTIDVDFSPSLDIDESDWVRYRVDYTLRIVNNSPQRLVNIYRGIAEFEMRGGSGLWKLDLWREIEPVENFTSWGYHKGEIRNQLGSG